jgi:hypothetical protein
MNPIGLARTSLSGVERQLDQMDRAAAQVNSQATAASDTVEISAAARGASAASAGSATQDGDLTGAMVNLGVSKYLAVANLKVLKTADELSKTVEDHVR